MNTATATTNTALPVSEDLSPADARALYRDELTLGEARALYFARTGFDEGTYFADDIELPVSFAGATRIVRLPNIAARKAAVRVHDLSHVLTGYGTTWLGEFQISAFEIGMGCRGYWAAWVLNAGGLAGGVVRAPAKMLRAFARGRRTSRSLYAIVPVWDDAILERHVGGLRREVGVHDDVDPTRTDVVLFGVAAIATWGFHLAPFAIAVAGLFAAFG